MSDATPHDSSDVGSTSSIPSSASWNEIKEGSHFLGRYRVVREIGRGGMARVFLARLDRPGGFLKWVAIKQIGAHLSADERAIQMFLTEARVAARINHPNVAQVFDLGAQEVDYWIAMEFLHGVSVSHVVRWNETRRERTPPDLAACIIADAAEGLHAAHELRDKDGTRLNLVHRDVAPQNIFLTYDGVVKVVDFGLASISQRTAADALGPRVGTFGYISPEQLRGSAVDRRADVFGLGIVLWELVTGRRLFRKHDRAATWNAVLRRRIPAPSSIVKGLAPELDAAIRKALSRRPNARFESALSMSRALRAYLMRVGRVVGPEELSTFLRSRFSKRLQLGDRFLDWAAELTQTLPFPSSGLSSLPAPPFTDEADSELPTRIMVPPQGSSKKKSRKGSGADEGPVVQAPPSSAAGADEITDVSEGRATLPLIATPAGTASPNVIRSREERRAFPRHRTCVPTHLEIAEGVLHAGMVRNLSVSGACLLTGCRLRVGAPVKLYVYISRNTDEPREITGRVARVSEHCRGAHLWTHEVAVRFDATVNDLEPEMKTVAREQAKAGVPQ